MSELWTFRDEVKQGRAGMADPVGKLDLEGYSVEAADGDVGKVDAAAYDDAESFVVVDTGLPVLGRKVLVPAGVVRGVDTVAEAIQLEVTKEQIENAPELDEARVRDAGYRTEVGRHYDSSAGE